MSEVLVHVTRNGEVGNLHRGDLVVVNLAGEIIYQVTDPYKVTYP